MLNMPTCAAFGGSLSARYRKTNTLGLSLDWFEPYTGFVVRWESSWTTNALLNDTAKIDLMGDGNAFKWVLGIDRPTLIRWLNPTRSFFLSAQAYGTHYPDSRAGRRGIVSENNNFIFTVFAQNHFMRDQLVYLVFGAFGTAAQDGTTGGNIEYLITNNWSVTLGFTAFLGARHRHDLGDIRSVQRQLVLWWPFRAPAPARAHTRKLASACSICRPVARSGTR